MFRCALFAKGGTFVRLLHALQYKSADTQRRLLRIDFFHFEDSFSIEISEIVLQFVTAFRDRSDTAPFSVADVEHFIDQPLSGGVAVSRDDPAVLVLDFRATGFQLLDSL